MAQAEFRHEMKDWDKAELDAYIARHYPAYWLKVDLTHKVSHAHFLKSAHEANKAVATGVGFDTARGVTELTVLAPDHPRLLSVIAGACAAAGANIVDAQIFTTTDGLAVDTIAVSREFDHNEDEARRALRIADSIERALRGELRLPEVMAKRFARKGRIKAFAIEPEVLINNQWSNRFTVIEVTGLDRPGLLYELTATISKLSLNIASAHVATFGERVVDVFYVTDLDRRADHRADAPGRDQARAAAAVRRGRAQGREGGVVTCCRALSPCRRGEVTTAGARGDFGRSKHASKRFVNHNSPLLPARNARCASATLSGYLTAH